MQLLRLNVSPSVSLLFHRSPVSFRGVATVPESICSVLRSQQGLRIIPPLVVSVLFVGGSLLSKLAETSVSSGVAEGL